MYAKKNELSVESQSNKLELISSAVYEGQRWPNPTQAQILNDEATAYVFLTFFLHAGPKTFS